MQCCGCCFSGAKLNVPQHTKQNIWLGSSSCAYNYFSIHLIKIYDDKYGKSKLHFFRTIKNNNTCTHNEKQKRLQNKKPLIFLVPQFFWIWNGIVLTKNFSHKNVRTFWPLWEHCFFVLINSENMSRTISFTPCMMGEEQDCVFKKLFLGIYWHAFVYSEYNTVLV